MRIHGWTVGKGGTEWYRIKEPLRGLRLLGHETTIGPILFNGGDKNDYDALLVRGLHDKWNSKAWHKLRELGRHTLIYDLDDDLWNWDTKTEQHAYWTNERLFQVEQNIIAADVVTTPSESFAMYLRQLNQNVIVVPNTVPKWLTTILPVREPGRSFVIGWEGAPHHVDDLELVWGPLFRFLLRHRETQFWMWGVDPRHYFDDYLPGFDGNRIKRTTWIKDVPTYYRSLDMDVCLAPLIASPFNETKSAIRVQEHSALGIPIIASRSPAYDNWLQPGINGVFASDQADWENHLEFLYRNPQVRYDMGIQGRNLAKRWTTEANAHRWDAIIRGKELVRHG